MRMLSAALKDRDGWADAAGTAAFLAILGALWVLL